MKGGERGEKDKVQEGKEVRRRDSCRDARKERDG